MRFLNDPLGVHVTGAFFDLASLFQHPRTPDQNRAFGQALNVMAIGYASPLGTLVARFDAMPPCPPELAAVVAVRGGADAPTGADAAKALRAALAGAGETPREVVSLAYDDAKGVWRAELGSAEAAEAAVAELESGGALCAALGEGARAFSWYNARPYEGRG